MATHPRHDWLELPVFQQPLLELEATFVIKRISQVAGSLGKVWKNRTGYEYPDMLQGIIASPRL
jgi:hypothetical protein